MRVKHRTVIKTRGAIIAAALATLGGASAAHAQLYWDADGTGAATGSTGITAGTTWLSSGVWATDLAGTSHQTWVQGSDAKLPAAGGTITFGGNITANSVEYLQPTGGYTFAGGVNTLNIGSGGFVLSNGSNAGLIVNATVTGNQGLNITKNSAASVINIIRFASANTFTGDVNINSNGGFNNNIYLRVSLDAPGAIPVGSQINLNTTQAQISSGGGGTAPTINVAVGQINMNGGGDNMLGAFANSATSYDILTVNGPITGNARLNFQTQTGGGGGVVVLNAASTYSGDTVFNTGTGATGFNKGWVVWGINNALPTTTNMNLGGIGSSVNFGTGAIDLAGFSQSVNSVGTNVGNVGNSAGITNTGASLSVLTVTGSENRFLNAPIGVPSSLVINNPTGSDLSNIRLVHNGPGSLILNNSTAGNSGNTYSGGTLVQQGTVLVNGWNSSTASAAVVSPGATFGGSGTYAGAVTDSGKIIVGGTGNVADFRTGALTLNPSGVASGATADYEFSTTGSEKIIVSGGVTLPTTGTEDLTITYTPGSLPANGLYSLITYSGTLTAPQFATLTKTVINGGGASFSLVNNPGSVDLLVTGGVDALIWKGPAGVGTGTWDTTTTNWVSTATPTTYSDGKIVGFDDTANGTGAVTVTISNGGTPVVPFLATFNNNTRNYVLTGTGNNVIGGTASLTKNGTGSLTITAAQQYTGDTNINAGTVIIGTGGGLGSTIVNVNPAGTLQVAGSTGLSSPTLNLVGGKLQFAGATASTYTSTVNVLAASTLDTGTTTTVAFSGGSGMLSGTSPITRTGTGTLTLSTPATGYSGGWFVNGGTVVINAVDGTGVSGLGSASGTNSNSWVNLASGTTLQIAGVVWGDYRNSTTSSPIVMSNGSTLIGSGTNSGYGRASAATNNSGLTVVRGADSSNITTVDIKTLAASDVFAIQNSIRQFGTFGGAGNSLIRVSGPGTVKLQDGGVSSATSYAGGWLVQAGVLQIGPVIFNPAGSGYGGPFGEPLNALGFAGTSANGDPDAPNPVTLTGGILALGIDQPNVAPGQNPNVTNFPVNPTPAYLRNPITLNGGALAATAQEVDYTPGDPAGDQGKPNATKVTARFGGDLTVQGTGSRILTANPALLTEGRTVQLVGGSRTLANASPNFAANSTITYVTTWNGVLTVDPGSAAAGTSSFDIIRDAGTFVVNPTASLVINANGTVNLGGAADALSDGTNFVNVTNNSVSSFNITQGTKNVGVISGVGKTNVNAGTTLVAKSIAQSNLTVNGTVRIRPNSQLSGVSNITTLVVNTGGKFNITDNKLVTKSAVGSWSGSDYTGVTGLIASGRNGGTVPLWDGTTGIITSQSTAVNGNLNSIAVAKASDALPASVSTTVVWAGQTVTGTDTLVMYTYGGDANLDGKLNVDDYIKIDTGIASNLTGYSNGDFNYDGKVNIDDYTTVIDANIGNQSGVFPTAGGVEIGGGVSGVSAVPEPASLSLLGLAAVGMLKRRRRQSR